MISRTDKAMAVLADALDWPDGFTREMLRDALKAAGCLKPGTDQQELAATGRYIRTWNKQHEGDIGNQFLRLTRPRENREACS